MFVRIVLPIQLEWFFRVTVLSFLYQILSSFCCLISSTRKYKKEYVKLYSDYGSRLLCLWCFWSPIPFYRDSPNSLLLGWRYVTNLLSLVLSSFSNISTMINPSTVYYCCWLNTTWPDIKYHERVEECDIIMINFTNRRLCYSVIYMLITVFWI